MAMGVLSPAFSSAIGAPITSVILRFFGVLFKVHMLNTNPAAMALLKLDAQGPIKLDTTGM